MQKEKPKRDPVVPEMRARLLANREGKIMRGQWLDMIVQPLVILALLLSASFLLFGEEMLAVMDDIWWVVLVAALLLLFLPVFIRAIRYSRAPVRFARLSAGIQPWWGFWKPMVFYTKADDLVRFPVRLAPRLPVKIGGEYLVYYLEEPDGKVLLSYAPADHEDAQTWMPSKDFGARRTRRA